MPHTNYRDADGLNDVPVSAATPLPVADAVGASAASPKFTAQSGLPYADASISSLSAGQAAGTAVILAADTARKALVINPPANCGLTLSSGGPVIWPLFANAPNSFTGQDCPTGALYLTAGLATAQALPMAEA